MMIDKKDREIFQDFTHSAGWAQGKNRTHGHAALAAAIYFLGTSYVANTLEGKGPERLIVNLRAFDCFTLVESCCALAILRHTGKDSFPDYVAILQSLRYRDGVIAGYPSRLHYFSDWLQNNEEGEVIRDVTQSLGGKPFRKVLNIMSTHAELYHPLHDQAACQQMTVIERRLSETTRHLLSKEEFSLWEDGIVDGDILAITTDQEGLDVCHVGIAVRIDGQLRLLHASPQAGQVVISPEMLVDYLHQSPHRTGIMAARLANPLESPGA